MSRITDQDKSQQAIHDLLTKSAAEAAAEAQSGDAEGTGSTKGAGKGKGHAKVHLQHLGHVGKGAGQAFEADHIDKSSAVGSKNKMADIDPLGTKADNDDTASKNDSLGEVSDLANVSTTQSSAVTKAKTQLNQALASDPLDTEKVKQATTSYIDALKGDGASDTAVKEGLDEVLSAPGLSADGMAAALVAAAKNGIDMSNSGADKVAGAKAQQAIAAAQKAEQKAAAQAAAEQAAANEAKAGNSATSDQNHASADGGGGTSGDSGDSGDTDTSGITGTSTGAANDTAGSGNYGNVNDPKASKEYKGMSIDQLLASHGPVSAAMKAHPELVEDIKKASAATNVPAGLLAGLVYMESSFNPNIETSTDSSGGQTGGVAQVQQAMVSHFVPGGKMENAADNIMTAAKAMAVVYKASNSWGTALRAWNSYDPSYKDEVDQVSKLTDLSKLPGKGAGIPNYVSNILNYTSEGKDAPG